MEILLFSILTLLLGIVIFQDFKSKEISWVLIPLLFIGFVVYALCKINFQELISYFFINFLIVAINLLGVTVIISLKEQKITNILKSHLGLGDVLFFIIITLVFSPFNFVFFYLGSILLITILSVFYLFFNKEKKTLIPLAGAMSLFLIVVLTIAEFGNSFHLYQDILTIG